MLDWALRLVLLIGLPASVGLIVLAEPLLATIFFGGEFTRMDVTMATASLIAYALGLLGFILVKVLATGYFSRQDTRTPVRIGVRAMVLNMVLNVVLVVSLVQANYPAPHAGLAAATTLSALFNAALLLRGLKATGVYVPAPGWRGFAARVCVATAAMGAAVYWLTVVVGDWTALALWSRIGALAAAVAIGIVVYVAAGFAAGLRPAALGLRGHRGPASL
jgi:putative peptidoglycan lipid II flippase